MLFKAISTLLFLLDESLFTNYFLLVELPLNLWTNKHFEIC